MSQSPWSNAMQFGPHTSAMQCKTHAGCCCAWPLHVICVCVASATCLNRQQAHKLQFASAVPSTTPECRGSKAFHTSRGQCVCWLQVLVVPSLVAVVKYGQLKHWTFAAAPSLDDLSGGSFSSGNTNTTQGHHGHWVAQQVLPDTAALFKPGAHSDVAVKVLSGNSSIS